MANTLAGVEQFVSLGTAAVTAGGNSAPPAGTQETWTLGGSTLPAANSSGTPPTGFYVADPAQPSEVILVKNISGSTATVIRGADGTTPIAHIPVFTVLQVSSGASLRSMIPLGLNAVTQFGADPTGTNDSAPAIQAALNALGAQGGTVFMPAGTYKVGSTLAIPAKCGLVGSPSATNKVNPAKPSVLKLANGVSNHMISVSAANVYISHLELDGNKANQTVSPNFPDVVLLNAGSDWSVIDNCYIHDSTYNGIAVNNGVQAIRIQDSSIQNAGNIGVLLGTGSSDHHISRCLIGSSAGANIFTGAYVVHITECDIWSAGTHGIQVDGTGTGTGTLITNCGIDRNSNHGILVTSLGVSVVACTLHSNGQATNNTYASICVDNTSFATTGCSIQACNFWIDGGITNNVAYHIQYKNTATAKVHGSGFINAAATANISAASAAKDTNETA